MPKSRGARHCGTRLRFEQRAANPTCQANVSAVVHNVSMRKVALRESPGIHLKVQSELTSARGNLFEKSVLADNAARLANELRHIGVVGETEPALTEQTFAARTCETPIWNSRAW